MTWMSRCKPVGQEFLDYDSYDGECDKTAVSKRQSTEVRRHWHFRLLSLLELVIAVVPASIGADIT